MTQYLCSWYEIEEVVAAGNAVKNGKVGDKAGLGWMSSSQMSCEQCMGGDHNLCAQGEATR